MGDFDEESGWEAEEDEMKVAYINYCFECAACDSDYFCCLRESKDLTEEEVYVKVPRWCPLEDAKEEEKNVKK